MKVIVILLAVILAWALNVRSLRRAMLSRSCLLLILASCTTVAQASANSNRTLYCVSIARCGDGITHESIARSTVPSIAYGYDVPVLLRGTRHVVATKPGGKPGQQQLFDTEPYDLVPKSAPKPLGRGSTGSARPNNLNEQLAMNEARSNPAAGQQVPLKSGMTDARWPASEGWVKMRQNVNGVEVHYVRNTRTGAVDDFKFK
jgi:hypothetical protein